MIIFSSLMKMHAKKQGPVLIAVSLSHVVVLRLLRIRAFKHYFTQWMSLESCIMGCRPIFVLS